MTDEQKPKKPFKLPYKDEEVLECKGPNCGMEIYFYTTKKGKIMPVTFSTREPHWIACKDAEFFRQRREAKGNGG